MLYKLGSKVRPYFIINKKFVNINWEAKGPHPTLLQIKNLLNKWGGGTMCHLPVLLKEEM